MTRWQELNQTLFTQTNANNNLAVKDLLQKSELYLLKLQIQNPAKGQANNRSQWVLSQHPIAINKALSITVTNEQPWQLSSNVRSRPEQILQQTIRENLPRASDLASVLKQLLTTSARQDIPKQLSQAVNSLRSSILKPEQLAQAPTLKLALKRSGIFWENNVRDDFKTTTVKEQQLPTIASRISQNYGGQPTSSRSNSGADNSSSAVDKLLRQLFTNTQNPKATNNTHTEVKQDTVKVAQNNNSTTNPSPLPNGVRDLKGQLLIIKQLTHWLLKPTTQTTPATDQAKALPAQQKAEPVLPKHQASQSDNAIKNQAIQRIQQQVMVALAKIQLQQSQSLLQQQNTGDGKPTNSVLQFELPVQVEGQLQNLRLQIEEDWLERDKDEVRETQQQKRWRVSLCVELPNAGNFYATITHINSETDVHLWADELTTATRVREHIDTLQQRLEKQGIQVKTLLCEHGSPTEQLFATKLECALVDVRT